MTDGELLLEFFRAYQELTGDLGAWTFWPTFGPDGHVDGGLFRFWSEDGDYRFTRAVSFGVLRSAVASQSQVWHTAKDDADKIRNRLEDLPLPR